jgi:multicomponent Na+:H+ antiporter subunit E
LKHNSFTSYLLLAIVLFMLWVLLSGSLAADELFAGIIVAIVAAIATSRIELFNGIKLEPYAPVALAKYLVNFVIALVRANLDMARRVLTPALPLHPEIVEIQTQLQSDLGRLLLANSITLTPGTLTVDVKDNRLLVHWVDSRGGANLEQATRAIAAGFEDHIKGFLK